MFRAIAILLCVFVAGCCDKPAETSAPRPMGPANDKILVMEKEEIVVGVTDPPTITVIKEFDQFELTDDPLPESIKLHYKWCTRSDRPDKLYLQCGFRVVGEASLKDRTWRRYHFLTKTWDDPVDCAPFPVPGW